jgi:hypothetical protein
MLTRLVGAYDTRDKVMPNHVLVGEPYNGDPVDAAQGFQRLGQT